MKKGTETSAFGTSGRENHNSDKFYDSKLYKEIKKRNPLVKIEQDNSFPKELENTIIQASSETMKDIPDNSVHLMITSPPYNVSKEYDEDLSLREYLDLLHKVFKETFRVLVHGGRACINVANIGRKPYIPLSDYVSHIMIDLGFDMRGEIIWNKAAGAGVSTAWGSWQSASNPILRDTHEYILVFSKGDYKRERKEKQNTITKDQFIGWTKSIWTMNPESAKKVGHPAPFPEELPYRLIQLYSFLDDIILDPFMGSGTTAVSALKSDRKFIGYDTDKGYIKLAETRLSRYRTQIRFGS
ncbi:MAG: site-specific DNA-methyltransferase [Chitinophagaceae bacterium]|nr:site-specific DNA-methyltransferase [Chitinophagaceae bacterium]